MLGQISRYVDSPNVRRVPSQSLMHTHSQILTSAARIIQRHESRHGNSPSTISTKIQNLLSQISARINDFSRNSSVLKSVENAPVQMAISPELAEDPGGTQPSYTSMLQEPFAAVVQRFWLTHLQVILNYIE